jgi:RNA polymerase sigma factor (sigma-70 family)
MEETKPLRTKTMTQTELVVSAQSGNQDAINQLVEDHIKYIRFMARRYDRKMRDDAEQFGVQGFLEAVRDFDTSKGYKLLTFASFRIRRSMQNIHRSEMKESLYEDILKSEDSDITAEGMIPSPELSKIEQKLRDALTELSDVEREILKLKYFEGFTCRQIGEILQLSHQRISQLENRAVKTLKGILSCR